MVGESVHVPVEHVSVWPDVVVPVMAGRTEFDGLLAAEKIARLRAARFA
jgi:hypothetical protein